MSTNIDWVYRLSSVKFILDGSYLDNYVTNVFIIPRDLSQFESTVQSIEFFLSLSNKSFLNFCS